MLIDGSKPEVIKAMLVKDMQLTIERHKWGAKVFEASGDVAPAKGMIGTLIGLVERPPWTTRNPSVRPWRWRC